MKEWSQQSVSPPNWPLTNVILVDDANLGPVEEGNEDAQGLCLGEGPRMQVNAELLSAVEIVQSGLEVRYVDGIADGLHVNAYSVVIGPEDGQCPSIYQATSSLGRMEAVILADVLNVIDKRRIGQYISVTVNALDGVAEGNLRLEVVLVNARPSADTAPYTGKVTSRGGQIAHALVGVSKWGGGSRWAGGRGGRGGRGFNSICVSSFTEDGTWLKTF